MKAAVIGLAVLLLLTGAARGAIPLPGSPDWTSQDNDYSTGGALADVDNNGYLDICVSNGNDMALDHNAVYLNEGGTLETTASWRSTDDGYFGHCYAGDVNNDGMPDLVSAYLGRNGNGELRARLYRNTGTGLETSPGWKAADPHSSFDCCLGDFDLDGDLDLAISAGDVYANDWDYARIYRNDAGTLDTLPCWTAQDSMLSDAIRFCDIDNDGDLDLFIGRYRKIAMYENQDGVLDSAPSWIARTGVGWILRLAFGDYDNDGFLDLAAASNSQRGSINNVKVFHNNSGTLDTIAAFTLLENETYSSCVAWGDVNGDGWLDLGAGGWWDPVVVFENDSGTLGPTPTWSWSPANPGNLVCETVMWGDVGNRHVVAAIARFDGDGARRLFTLPRRPVQFLDSITVNGERLNPGDFCFDPLAGWFSLAATPPPGSSNVACHYRYSTHHDLCVTNWDRTNGNFLFHNTTPSGIAGPHSAPTLAMLIARPNPASGRMTIRLTGPGVPVPTGLHIYRQDGTLARTIATPAPGNPVWTWNGRDNMGNLLPSGIYFARTGMAGTSLKLIRTR